METETAFVYLDSGFVVEDSKDKTDGEIIHDVAQQIITQLSVDERAVTWLIERE